MTAEDQGFLQALVGQYQDYYGQTLTAGTPCWHDAILRTQCEQAWLAQSFEKHTYQALLDLITLGWTDEDYFTCLAHQLAEGETVLLCLAAQCVQRDRDRTRDLLQRYLSEEILFWDWDAPCDGQKAKQMEQFAESAQVMACLLPAEFGAFCVKWIVQVPLDREFVPELLLKGIVLTCPDQLVTFLQSPDWHMGLKIGLLNYICESSVRREGIYRQLKVFFKQAQDAEEKQFLGVLLGEYGDPNGIPVLRKYLESLVAQTPINQEACREIASAIYKLGGQYEDIMHI